MQVFIDVDVDTSALDQALEKTERLLKLEQQLAATRGQMHTGGTEAGLAAAAIAVVAGSSHQLSRRALLGLGWRRPAITNHHAD